MRGTIVGASGTLPAGHVIAGRYVVEGLLGRGGMGEVYEARDDKLGRSVALKVVAAASASSGAKRRLEAEAKAVASLDHAGIVVLHDVLEEGDALVLVMELVRGMSLRARLATGPLVGAEVARIVIRIAEALAAAHEQGLVHRDVKPDNVMVRKDGRTALLDFGVAKAMERDDPTAAPPTTTAEGAMVGTPAYLAPEQVRGEALGAATDQFALAVTAYELLVGKLPWNAATMPRLIAAIVSDPPGSVGDAVGAAGAAVDGVLGRALAKDPAARFEGVVAFAAALATVLEDAPAAAPDAAERILSSGRKRRAEVTTGDAPQPAAAPTPSPRRLLVPAAAALAAFAALWWMSRRGAPPLPPAPSGTSTATAAPAASASATVRWDDLSPSGATEDRDRAALREAVSAFRSGDNERARALVDDLLRRRPIAGAYLFRAYVSYVRAVGLDEPARAAFREATRLRAALSPRDAALLDALAPSFLDPPRWRETAELLDAFVRARPRDVQGWDALGFARVKLGDHDAARAAFTAELDVDPRAAIASDLAAQLLMVAHEDKRARELLVACVKNDPAAIGCRTALVGLLLVTGECAEADREGRDALAVQPDNFRAFTGRARANGGLAASNEVVAGFLTQARRALSPEKLRVREIEDAYLLAMRAGDFSAALEALDARPLAEGEIDADDAGRLALGRVQTLWEQGDGAKAADAAEAYLGRVATRRLPERPWADPTGSMLAYLRAAGRVSPGEHEARRKVWIDAWRAQRTPAEWRNDGALDVWTSAYFPVGPFDAATAHAALAAASELDLTPAEYHDIHQDQVLVSVDARTGELLAVAGRLEEAEKPLSIAARACRILPEHRARLALGDLYAKKGDAARACEAYAAIEKAWGHAKPKSVTAEAARAAAKRAKCPGS